MANGHPSDDARTLEPVIFKIALKRRLRVRVQDEDTYCPMCGGTMDSFDDHALACPCKGDRTIRHNRLRDAVYDVATNWNMAPERETLGLASGRPPDDGLRSTQDPTCGNVDGTGDAKRRKKPADIFIPRAIGRSPVALDFACRSALRSDCLRDAALDHEAILQACEQPKKISGQSPKQSRPRLFAPAKDCNSYP